MGHFMGGLSAILLATTLLAGCSGTDSGGDDGATATVTTTKTTTRPAGGVPQVMFERDESFDRLYVAAQTAAEADWNRIAIQINASRNTYPHYPIHMGQSFGAEPYGNTAGYQNENAVERPDKANRIDVGQPVRVTDVSAQMVYKEEEHGASDFIEFCANSPVHDEYVMVFDVPSGKKIGEYFFSVIETCPTFYG